MVRFDAVRSGAGARSLARALFFISAFGSLTIISHPDVPTLDYPFFFSNLHGPYFFLDVIPLTTGIFFQIFGEFPSVLAAEPRTQWRGKLEVILQ